MNHKNSKKIEAEKEAPPRSIQIGIQAGIQTLFNPVIHKRVPSAAQVEAMCGKRRENNIVAVCAMPKSGSTFLANVLKQTLQKRYIPLCFAYSSNEHDLYLPAMLAAQSIGAVSQLHIKGTPHNVALFNAFGITPVVLIRNIFDALESLARDLRAKEQLSYYGTGFIGYSFLWLSRDIKTLSREQLHDYVIDYALPWYVNFYASWSELEMMKVVSPVWIQYEELMAEKRRVIENLLSRLGYDDSAIVGLEKNYISNKGGIGAGSGQSGLGRERFNADQIERIIAKFRYYPRIDFSKVGITP